MNYNMNEIDKLLSESLNMLRTIEQNLQKAKPKTIIMVQRAEEKTRVKRKRIPNPKASPSQKMLH